MLQNIIEFQANHQYVDLKEDLPKPIKLNIPEWYKKLQHSATKLTIKGCVPVMDSLTTGYVLSLPQDIILKNNVLEDNKIISRMIPSVQDTLKTIDLNINVEEKATGEISAGAGLGTTGGSIQAGIKISSWIFLLICTTFK